MIFRNPAKIITDSPDIKIHGEKIEQLKPLIFLEYILTRTWIGDTIWIKFQ